MISSQKDQLLRSWHFAKVLFSRFLSNWLMCCFGGWGVGSNRINRRKIPKTLISQGQSEEGKQTLSTCYPEPQSLKQMASVVTGQTPDPSMPWSGQIQLASARLTCFWIPQPAYNFRHFPVLTLDRRNPCWRTGTGLHGNTASACYSKDRGRRTGHLRVNTGSSPRAGEVQDHPQLPNCVMAFHLHSLTAGHHFTCRILESKYRTSAEQLRPQNLFWYFSGLVK